MNCATFDRWLDEGMPLGLADAARRHAAVCSGCAASLRAAKAVEAAFVEETIAVPVGFAERVMERVLSAEGSRPPLPIDLDGPPLPLWIRCLMQPSVALTGLLAACLIAWGSDLFRLGLDLYAAIDAGFTDLAGGGFLAQHASAAWVAGISLLALLPFAGQALYRAGTRLSDPRGR